MDNEKKIMKEYEQYQLDTIYSDIRNRNFSYVDEKVKVEIDEVLKLVTIYDIDGSVLVDGKIIESIPCINKDNIEEFSFGNDSNYLMIEYENKLDNKKCVGVFDKKTGFAVISDIEKYYVKFNSKSKNSILENVKSLLKSKTKKKDKVKLILDSSKIVEYLSKINTTGNNCIWYYEKDKINVYSIYDRTKMIQVDKKEVPGEIKSMYAFPTKIIGNYSSNFVINSFLYDIENKECKSLDKSIYIYKLDGNLIHNSIGSKVFFLDDRTGAIVNVTDDLHYFKKASGRLIRLGTPIVSFDEFKKLNKISDEDKRKEELQSKINTKVYYFAEEKKKFEVASKKRKEELERMFNKINMLLADKETCDMADQFLHSISIERKDLFELVDDHYEILPMYRGMLKFLDLSNINFKNTKVSDINFNGSNASIDPQTVYKRDISNSVFNEFSFTPFTDFSNVIANGTDFTNCNNFINLNGAIADENTKLPAIEGTIKRRF